MNIPRWKRWLSYLQELPLEAGETDLNPDLKLGLRRGRFCLSTPNAIYSYGDLYDNFLNAFRKIDLDQQQISEVLVLGFGLGSIPFMLEKIFQKKYCYTGVEADEVIAQWASKYVLPELQSPVQLHLGDAKVFTETCQERFDLICMDIFLDNVVPTAFEQIDFLENLKSLLSEDGLLLFNRMTFRQEDKKTTLDFFEKKFKQAFPSGKYFDLGGNWMLLNQ